MVTAAEDAEFPHSLLLSIPFPTSRLAKIAQGSLSVDVELSPLVRRTFALVPSSTFTSSPASSPGPVPTPQSPPADDHNDEFKTVLQVHYRATTPRMLRVAVNGFFESLSLVVQVMAELDVDVLHSKGIEGLEGVQGVEEGLTGSVGGVVAAG